MHKFCRKNVFNVIIFLYFCRLSLAYVSSLYSLIAMSSIFVMFLSQFNLISSNVTTEEQIKASWRGWTRCLGFKPKNNSLDHGFVKNWWSFWRGDRELVVEYVGGVRHSTSGACRSGGCQNC